MYFSQYVLNDYHISKCLYLMYFVLFVSGMYRWFNAKLGGKSLTDPGVKKGLGLRAYG